MRPSIWIGLVLGALGYGFSYLARTLTYTIPVTTQQAFATQFTVALFLLFSAFLLGAGLASVLHWIFGLTRHYFAFFLQLAFSIALFFIGVGVTITSKNWMLALHVFFTGLVASLTLFLLAFTNLIGGVAETITKTVNQALKRMPWQKTRSRKARS